MGWSGALGILMFRNTFSETNGRFGCVSSRHRTTAVCVEPTGKIADGGKAALNPTKQRHHGPDYRERCRDRGTGGNAGAHQSRAEPETEDARGPAHHDSGGVQVRYPDCVPGKYSVWVSQVRP